MGLHPERQATVLSRTESASVEWIDPLHDRRWADLVASSPVATAFHHPAWLGLLAGEYGYEMFACCVLNPAGALDAGLPLARVKSRLTGTRIVSLPFSDLVAPLYATGHEQRSEMALGRALNTESRRTRVDLHFHAPLSAIANSRPGERFWHHTLPLANGFDAVQRGFCDMHRRGARKARREGVSISYGTNRASIDAFYGLHLETRHRQGIPTQSRRFFRAFAELFSHGLGHIALAEWRGRPIAAGVFLSWNGTLIYKYGASDRREQNKRPNNLIFAEEIRRGCERGMHTLDFGRTGLDNPGLRAFKLNWGAEENELSYTTLAENNVRRHAVKHTRLQRAAIRRAPAVVGRLVGTALYRHFA